MRLKAINLTNFKAFKQLDNLEITPITILCGSNSSGKSTIIQSLLLLKQTLDSSYNKCPLLLNGDFVKLDSYKNIVFGKDEKTEIGMDLLFEYKGKNAIVQNKFDSTFYINSDKLLVKSLKYTEITIKENKQDESSIYLTHQQEDKYQIETQNMKGKLDIKEEIDKNSRKFIPVKFKAIIPTPILDDDEKPKDINIRFGIFAITSRPIQHIFSKFHYIGPLRDFPKRRDWRNPDITEIGIKGENSANVLLNEINTKLRSDFYLYDNEKHEFMKFKETSLFGRLSAWAELLNFHLINSKEDNQIASIRLDSYTGKEVTIADVGFGLSQILPILIEGLRIEESDTLILEQPEIHLHPGMQTNLGDFLISLALANKNCIVETHSDHLINRLVRRIIEDPTGKLNELISIYFIENVSATEGSIIKKINIDENKGIVNWPTGFFDQGANEKEKIIEALLKKKKIR